MCIALCALQMQIRKSYWPHAGAFSFFLSSPCEQYENQCPFSQGGYKDEQQKPCKTAFIMKKWSRISIQIISITVAKGPSFWMLCIGSAVHAKHDTTLVR